MAKNINFLHQRHQVLTKAQAQDRKWWHWSLMGLGVVFVVVAVTVGLRIFMGGRLTRVQAAQEQTKSTIISSESVERTYVISVHKLGVLSTLFQDRLNKQQAITFFSSVFGPQVLVKGIAYEGADQLLTFQLQAKDVFILERVLTLINSDQVKDRYTRVSPRDLRRANDGTYQMSVEVVLLAPKAEAAESKP